MVKVYIGPKLSDWLVCTPLPTIGSTLNSIFLKPNPKPIILTKIFRTADSLCSAVRLKTGAVRIDSTTVVINRCFQQLSEFPRLAAVCRGVSSHDWLLPAISSGGSRICIIMAVIAYNCHIPWLWSEQLNMFD